MMPIPPYPISIRRLRVDLSTGFPRHWFAGDAFRSQLFNAMSMSFPPGEQFFMDSVRAALPWVQDEQLQSEARSFIGQEATHRHIHAQYNAQLEKQGLRYFIEPWVNWRVQASKKFHPLTNLAATLAFEHFTAALADDILRRPSRLQDVAEPLKTIWTWHAIEEAEHKAVAFDVYHAAGGGYARRIAWFFYVCLTFTLDLSVQTIHNLYRDGQLHRPGTWWSAARHYFGRQGIAWVLIPQALRYLSPHFHPWQEDNRELAEQWLQENSHVFM